MSCCTCGLAAPFGGFCPPLGIPPVLNVPVVRKLTRLQLVPVQRIKQAFVPVPFVQQAVVTVPVKRVAQVPVQVPVQALQAVPVQVPVCVNVSFAPVAAKPFICPPATTLLDP